MLQNRTDSQLMPIENASTARDAGDLLFASVAGLNQGPGISLLAGLRA